MSPLHLGLPQNRFPLETLHGTRERGPQKRTSDPPPVHVRTPTLSHNFIKAVPISFGSREGSWI